MLDKKIKRFFVVNIITVLAVCVIVFAWVIWYMQDQTEKSMVEIYDRSKPADTAEVRFDHQPAAESGKWDHSAYTA